VVVPSLAFLSEDCVEFWRDVVEFVLVLIGVGKQVVVLSFRRIFDYWRWLE
jgi:hypothetical protein